MSDYLALYRRYRPTQFDNVIGQNHIIQTLVNQIKFSRLGHAYLFTGSRGTGKTSVAKIFAKAINCLSPENGSPCGKCEVCLALNEPNNIDIIEIDAASNNGVNEIRELRENVQYPPVTCSKKVYIIDEVHMLTGAAFNALLKTLEEPPKHTVFILATTEVHKIPATILSRCMRFDFRLVATEKIAELIALIFDKENKQYDKEAIFAIAKAGEGSVRDALSIADTCISSNSKVLTYDDVMEMIGSSNHEIIFNYLNYVFNNDVNNVMHLIEFLCSQGKSIGVLINDVTSILRELIIIKNCENANLILNLPDSMFEKLTELAKNVNQDRIFYMLQIFSGIEGNIRYSNNPRTIFEIASLKACRPETDYNIDAVLLRIKELENKMDVFLTNPKQPVLNQEPFKKEVVDKALDKKIDINLLTPIEIKGKILSGLRDNGREMLWNVLQGVKISVSGGIINLNVSSQGDFDIIEKQESITAIKEALHDITFSEIVVLLSEKEKDLNEIDEASEQIKKIFGDDIVIIKD